jgi:hypothetical protein
MALLPAIRAALSFVVNSIMKGTKVVFRLKYVLDALCETENFGEPQTTEMLHDLAKKYAREIISMHWKIYV